MDSVWWNVWWPWALVWTAMVAAAVAGGYLLFAHWRARDAGGHPARGISLNLNAAAVMDLYLGGVYRTALNQEVEEEISASKVGNLNAEIYGIGGTASKSVDRKVFRKYIEIAEPITVIRIVMEVLEKADDIIYVDLIDGSVEPGRALRKALRSANRPTDDTDLSFSDLGDLEVYVSVRGRFRQLTATPEVITFVGSCGRTAGRPPQAHITCQTDGMRHAVPQGAFQARCLGRVRNWDPDADRLVIDPIAIFQ